MSRSIPVLYYHRIGSPDAIHLSIPTELFDRQIAFLVKRGIRSLTMERLFRHINGADPVDFPAFAVTFDDGFRDNLINALPILQKYRCHAAIFPVSSLIRPDSEAPNESPRDFNLAHLAARNGDRGDFLSRREMTEMIESGLIEFHSHSQLHNQVFTGNSLEGLFPDTDAHWGVTSAYGQSLSDSTWPIFPRGPGLVNRAWKIDFELMKSGNHDWKALWKSKQAGNTEAFSKKWLVRESEAVFDARVRKDLAESRETFSAFHPPGYDLLCWPWGAFHDRTVSLAREAGYIGAFATSTGPNLPGGNPFAINRYPVKKPDMVRFALSFWIRSSPALAGVYQLFRDRNR